MNNETNFTADYILTYTGLKMDVFNPTIDMICIEDIAHSLSNTCRFGGHTQAFYSVAEHSIRCSYLAQRNKLQALLHDASEAYLMDIPRPIKNKLVGYQEMEDNLMTLIAKKFGFEFPLTEDVIAVDNIMLDLEWGNIFVNHEWIPMSPSGAKEIFLKRFKQLTI